MFGNAFEGEADPVSFDNMAKAIEAFEATLLTPSPFDAWLNGDDAALDEVQLACLTLFMDKGCVACHSGINVGGHDYYPFGLIEKPGSDVLPEGDKGRFAVTETADDEYVFRAAPLRNIAETAPYFHSGKVWDLNVAVQIMAESQLGEELTADEAGKIVAFLGALSGPAPAVSVPMLPAETSATPRPTAEVLPN
jgi:cytochrome c peroxidase